MSGKWSETLACFENYRPKGKDEQRHANGRKKISIIYHLILVYHHHRTINFFRNAWLAITINKLTKEIIIHYCWVTAHCCEESFHEHHNEIFNTILPVKLVFKAQRSLITYACQVLASEQMGFILRLAFCRPGGFSIGLIS